MKKNEEEAITSSSSLFKPIKLSGNVYINSWKKASSVNIIKKKGGNSASNGFKNMSDQIKSFRNNKISNSIIGLKNIRANQQEDSKFLSQSART